MLETEAESAHDGDGRDPVLPLHGHDSSPYLLVLHLDSELDLFKCFHAAHGTQPLRPSGRDLPFVLHCGRVDDGARAGVVGDVVRLLGPGDGGGAEIADREEG